MVQHATPSMRFHMSRSLTPGLREIGRVCVHPHCDEQNSHDQDAALDVEVVLV